MLAIFEPSGHGTSYFKDGSIRQVWKERERDDFVKILVSFSNENTKRKN